MMASIKYGFLPLIVLSLTFTASLPSIPNILIKQFLEKMWGDWSKKRGGRRSHFWPPFLMTLVKNVCPLQSGKMFNKCDVIRTQKLHGKRRSAAQINCFWWEQFIFDWRGKFYGWAINLRWLLNRLNSQPTFVTKREISFIYIVQFWWGQETPFLNCRSLSDHLKLVQLLSFRCLNVQWWN